MWEGDCGILPVVDDGELVGVVTHRDMYIAHCSGELGRPVELEGEDYAVLATVSSTPAGRVARAPRQRQRQRRGPTRREKVESTCGNAFGSCVDRRNSCPHASIRLPAIAPRSPPPVRAVTQTE